MNSYPKVTLAELAIAKGMTVTDELLDLLNEAYELGVEDTY
jgi:hypothetical protein